KDPIHYYQLKQGSIVEQSTVAGGRGFKNLGTRYDPSSDWSEVTDYVKNHDYDNKGSLQIGYKGVYWVNNKKRNLNHAVNFLYYKEVDGQQRIYAYDNEYPDREIYFYKDSSGTIYQSVGGAPERRIECIALRDVSLYLSKAGKFDSTKSFYAEIGAIIISNSTAYFMETDNEDAEEVIIEVPDGVTEVTIIHQDDNATFQYMGVEYSFDKVDDDTVGKFVLAVTDEDGSTVEQPVFEIENDSELKAVTEAKAAAKAEIDKAVPADASDAVKALAETAKKNIDAATRIDEVNAAKQSGVDAINSYLAKESATAPVIDGFGIVNGSKGTLNADYKSTVIFHTTAKAPDGYKIVWSNGQEGDECKFTAIKSEYKISAKLVNNSTGETVQTTEEVTVKVSATFIAKIIAFFKSLFGSLPTYEDFKKK
ncbi:MAG: DUF1542 domain-containing protein, partial [Clostridia bacterium]|nr:DUF1542 domain-containing protein [Clostridia bacterium]